LAWEKKHEYKKALADYERAMQINPRCDGAINGQAWLLATCPDESCRSGKKAIELAKRACELTDWQSGEYLDSLAAACAEAGEFDQAMKWETKALEDAAFEKNSGARARKCLELYQAGKPYRE
jgi:tetratricopeptide (TPR) repeat protein